MPQQSDGRGVRLTAASAPETTLSPAPTSNRRQARSAGITLNYTALGEMLKHRRTLLGHTQKQAGKASHTSASTVSRLEAGLLKGLDVETYAKLCLYIALPMERFIEGATPATRDIVTALHALLLGEANLSEHARRALVEIFKAAYNGMRGRDSED